VRRGRSTEGLRRTGKDSKADRYFSIISKDRVLDLEASSAEMAEFFATRLTLMISVFFFFMFRIFLVVVVVLPSRES